MVRYGMVIDLNRCIGCHTCSLACKVENFTEPGIFWSFVEDEEIGTYPSVNRRFIPRLCMHCKNAACVEVCPTGASYKREDGIVLVDPDLCVGCQSCVVACPYGARYFKKENTGYFALGFTPYEALGFSKHRPGVAEGCTFCHHRLERDEEPACVRACPVEARILGDINDPTSRVSELIGSGRIFQFHKDLDCEPSVFYLLPGGKTLIRSTVNAVNGSQEKKG
ncbi:MAG: 4Fe-4S dicluster domain-containing protein [Deltaproteobacteria bacterium]|nr:MAG: 4Fe-4S dicluster domain-containing protein [Deltaproteobacteria bacterium]